MGAYILRRFGQAILILIGITLVTFFLLYVVPADPAQMIAGRGIQQRADDGEYPRAARPRTCRSTSSICAMSGTCCRAISGAPTCSGPRSRR